jgi:Zn-finger nucleic acid-binding protein
MKCPKCSGELKIAERSGIEIDYCSDCRGVWLDAGELDKIIERQRAEGQVRGQHPQHKRESWWERVLDVF